VCLALGASFARLQDEVRRAKRDDLKLLSISFDPQRDTADALRAYAETQGADASIWSMARVGDAAELRRLLDAFGVVVIPDEFGGFTHNAAIHLVDRSGRLSMIVDFEHVALAMKRLGLWTRG
jgi:protein SCO1/2